MVDKWRLLEANHINAIVDGYEATIADFRDTLGFTVDMLIPGKADVTDACLMTLGGVMFEFFAPKQTVEGLGALLGRYGNAYIGIEYRVADVGAVRKICEDRGVRISRDFGTVFVTDPDSCFGVSVEFWDGDFRQHDQPSGYWENEHPLALTGLARLTVAVENAESATSRLHDLAVVSTIGPVSRPLAAAEGVQLQVGDAVWELLEPTGPGPLAEFLAVYHERIRSVVFRTRDLGRVERHLTDQGLVVVPGDSDGSMAIHPRQNRNIRLEFVE